MADNPSSESLTTKAFWITMIGAALYIGCVFAFVL